MSETKQDKADRLKKVDAECDHWLASEDGGLALTPPAYGELRKSMEKRLRLAFRAGAALKLGLILVLLTLTATAGAQDLTWKRDGFPPLDIGRATTATERADVARNAIAAIGPQVTPLDKITLRGDFDFGKDVPMNWPACNYVADGATLRHQMMIDKTDVKPLGTPGFLLALGGKATTFKGFKFSFPCWDPNEDGGGIGWNAEGDGSVVFTDCEFDCERCDWPFYNWTKGRKSVLFSGGSAKNVPRGFANLVDSGADNGQSVEFRNFTATLNANASKSFGDSSKADLNSGAATALVVARGGKVTLRNVTIVDAVGLAKQYDQRNPPTHGPVRIAALMTTRYYTPGQPVELLIDKCVVQKITPNLATVWCDVDIRPTDKLTEVYDVAKIKAAQEAGLKSVADAAAKADGSVAAARGGSGENGNLKTIVK